MARMTKISASCLNIRLHPHSEGANTYIEWLENIFNKKIIAPVHGDRYGMISLLDRSEISKCILTGVITTFLKFDKKSNWFNTDELKAATNDQISNVNIPENLYPNPATYYFKLDAEKHRLFFQTYSKGKTFTPNSAFKFFSELSRNIHIMGIFGEAKITIIQDTSNLEIMFSIEKINEITVTIVKPNPDIFDDDFEKNIEKHMQETQSSQISITYKAEQGASIKPDDDIMKISKTALLNGDVNVKGRDGNGAVSLNSLKSPMQLHDKFDSDIQSEKSAFLRLVAYAKRAGS